MDIWKQVGATSVRGIKMESHAPTCVGTRWDTHPHAGKRQASAGRNAHVRYTRQLFSILFLFFFFFTITY